MKNKKQNNIYLFISVLIFLGTQSFLFMNQFEFIHFDNSKVTFKNLNEVPSGDIFFSGDIYGFLEECSTCLGIKRFLPKMAYYIKTHKDYLYFDIGDFTSYSKQMNAIQLPHLNNIIEYLKISAINLTKKDYLFLDDDFFKSVSTKIISSNLKISNKSSFLLPEVEYFKFILKNDSNHRNITISVLGLTDNRRLLGYWGKEYSILDQSVSLRKTISMLNEQAIFTILLYHDSMLNLKKLLKKFSRKDINLVIASYGQDVSKRFFFINGIPIAYIGERAKILGHIRLFYQSKNNFLVKYHPISMGIGLHEDTYILNLMNSIKLTNSSSLDGDKLN